MIAALVALLVALLAGWAPAAVAEPALTHSDRPTTPHYAPPRALTPSEPSTTPHPAPPAADPACAAGEEWQHGFGCVAVQLDAERTGRA